MPLTRCVAEILFQLSCSAANGRVCVCVYEFCENVELLYNMEKEKLD